MGTNPHDNGRNITRLTVSGGKSVEPRLYMAHPTKRQRIKDALPQLLAALVVIAAVIAIALAGRAGLS